jgi:hypothetical protein
LKFEEADTLTEPTEPTESRTETIDISAIKDEIKSLRKVREAQKHTHFSAGNILIFGGMWADKLFPDHM